MLTQRHIAREITDPTLKQVLKETAGIGTEATRAGIIKTLFDRQFLEKDGKKALKSTTAGRALIDSLPDPVKQPATTTLCEQALEEVAHGQATLTPFLGKQGEWVRSILQEMTGLSATSRPVEAAMREESKACAACGKPMRFREGKHGAFYGCSGYPECRKTMPSDGKAAKSPTKAPLKSKTARSSAVASTIAKSGEHCPKCNKGKVVTRIIKNGQNAGKEFHGCTGYPKCNYFAWSNVPSNKSE